ncbi:MAG: TrkH family potassium uptake protein [Armatimonadota bacterium]
MENQNSRQKIALLRPATTIALSFAILIAIGTLLLSIPACRVDKAIVPYNAFFTATSAVCVTGLVVEDTGTTYTTFGQIVILLLIQLGGLGYMTVATVVAIILGKEPGVTERITLKESYGLQKLSGVVRLTRNTLFFTLICEAIGAIILMLRFAATTAISGWQAVYYGIFHSVSAFCNAGFDIMGPEYGKFSSLTNFVSDPVISFIIPALFIIGGLGYPVVEEIIRGKKRKWSLHAKLVILTSIALLFLGTFAIMTLEWSNPDTLRGMSFTQKLMSSFFQSATCRTAGFNTLDIGSFHATTLAIMGMLMFIGASPGGTGGGVKTTTIVLMIIAVISIIRGKQDSEIFGKRIPQENINKALAISIVAALIVIICTIMLTFTEVDFINPKHKANFVDVQFEALSAWGTVGLSTGITPDLCSFGRIVIIILMFVGRIGPLTAFAALAFREKPVKRRLAEENVVIG